MQRILEVNEIILFTPPSTYMFQMTSLELLSKMLI